MNPQDHHEHPFYGTEILRQREQHYIHKLLSKYKNEPADEKLKEKIWNDLQKEKHLGNIHIPFKVALRKDPLGKFPSSVEVILDSKV